MKDDPDRQKKFMEVHVPEHLHDMVRSHYKDAVTRGRE